VAFLRLKGSELVIVADPHHISHGSQLQLERHVLEREMEFRDLLLIRPSTPPLHVHSAIAREGPAGKPEGETHVGYISGKHVERTPTHPSAALSASSMHLNNTPFSSTPAEILTSPSSTPYSAAQPSSS
jgi:hypothetical protein